MRSTFAPLLFAALAASAALMAPAQADTPASKPSDTRILPSGVRVQTLVSSTSAAYPTADSVVLVHYRGHLEDGREFDSSYERGQPLRLPLNRVIPCWTEGLQQLSIGTQARLFCPSNTAYGARGAGNGVIPPHANLIFEIELVDILP
jgi:FKBP-type peptidyl-prolyl cis-trans isomerase FkpA